MEHEPLAAHSCQSALKLYAQNNPQFWDFVELPQSFKQQPKSIFLNQVKDASVRSSPAVAAPARRTEIELDQHSSLI